MKKEIVIECNSCDGTGLYKGMAERDECAVVCVTCQGKGSVNYSYRPFNGRKDRKGIKRVFSKSCGYVHSAKNAETITGNVINFEKGGCTYEEWKNGEIPKPVRELYCPYIWDNRGIGKEPLSDCRIHLKGFGNISGCAKYSQKDECWKKLDLVKLKEEQ